MSTLTTQVIKNVQTNYQSARSLMIAKSDHTDIFNTAVPTSANKLYSVKATMSGTSDVYDLYGTLDDPLGDTVRFAEVHVLNISNTATDSAGTLTILGGATDIPILTSAAAYITVPWGSEFFWQNARGTAFTSAQANITLRGTAGQAAYEMIVIGS